MEFWQPGSYGSLCVGDFNHAANREDGIPNQSGYRLQARDQETKFTSALDESHPKSAQSLASEATFSTCNSSGYRVSCFFTVEEALGGWRRDGRRQPWMRTLAATTHVVLGDRQMGCGIGAL